MKGITPIPKSQFIQAIVDSLNSRMFSAANSDSLFYNQLVSANTILNPSTWSPANLDDINFGDKSISFLCETFRLGDKTALVGKLREFVDSGGRRVDLVGAITSAVSVIAVSSAECERGFRAMNGIMTKYRASMKHWLSFRRQDVNTFSLPKKIECLFVSDLSPRVVLSCHDINQNEGS